MAKKTYTPEEYKAKIEKKTEKRKKFNAVFTKALALFLGCAILYSATIISTKRIEMAKNGTAGGSLTSNQGGNNAGGQQDSDVGIFDNDNQNTDTPSQSGDNAQDSQTNDNKPADDKQNSDTNAESDPLKTSKGQFDYFVKSLKNVKTNAKSVNNYWKKGSNYKGIAEAGALSSILGNLMGSLLKEEEPKDAVYTGDDIKAKFPPAGTECGLETKRVKDISFKEEGDYYIIKVTVKDEVNPTAGKGVGAIASPLTRESIMDPIKNVPGLKNLDPTCSYENVNCEAKIEKATGNMVHYYTDLPLILSFEKQGYKVGLEFEEKWEISY